VHGGIQMEMLDLRQDNLPFTFLRNGTEFPSGNGVMWQLVYGKDSDKYPVLCISDIIKD